MAPEILIFSIWAAVLIPGNGTPGEPIPPLEFVPPSQFSPRPFKLQKIDKSSDPLRNNPGQEKPPKEEIKQGADPKGWREFQWGLTKEEARLLGAESFVNSRGEKSFGLREMEILPGAKFWVDLGFYSHMRLAWIGIEMYPEDSCGRAKYEALLEDFRNRYGAEKESNDLDYPNAWYLSHIWIAGYTKIELHQSCAKPNRTSSSHPSNLTKIYLEKRRTIELWNR